MTDEKCEKDFARDRWLGGQGIEVVGIGAGEVYGRPGDVADQVIRRALERIGGGWAFVAAFPLHHPLFGGRSPSPVCDGKGDEGILGDRISCPR